MAPAKVGPCIASLLKGSRGIFGARAPGAHVDGARRRRPTPVHHSRVAARHRSDGWKLWDRRSVDSAYAHAAGNHFSEHTLTLGQRCTQKVGAIGAFAEIYEYGP